MNLELCSWQSPSYLALSTGSWRLPEEPGGVGGERRGRGGGGGEEFHWFQRLTLASHASPGIADPSPRTPEYPAKASPALGEQLEHSWRDGELLRPHGVMVPQYDTHRLTRNLEEPPLALWISIIKLSLSHDLDIVTEGVWALCLPSSSAVSREAYRFTLTLTLWFGEENEGQSWAGYCPLWKAPQSLAPSPLDVVQPPWVGRASKKFPKVSFGLGLWLLG